MKDARRLQLIGNIYTLTLLTYFYDIKTRKIGYDIRYQVGFKL